MMRDNFSKGGGQLFGVGKIVAVSVMAAAAFFADEIIDMADLVKGLVASHLVKYSVEERIAAIAAKKPHLLDVACRAGGRLRIFVFKTERTVELNAPGWDGPLRYPMTGFSGKLGPKLAEGDRQIPEGVYGIEYLNPNSRFHLSLKVDYPNQDDKRWAKREGRENLGGDIMIHGKDATIGCVPIGDEAIEDVFYLVNAVGVKNVEVIIAPYDMRSGRQKRYENSSLPWYGELCAKIENALRI